MALLKTRVSDILIGVGLSKGIGGTESAQFTSNSKKPVTRGVDAMAKPGVAGPGRCETAKGGGCSGCWFRKKGGRGRENNSPDQGIRRTTLTMAMVQGIRRIEPLNSTMTETPENTI